MDRLLKKGLLAMLLAACVFTVEAEIYKWVDKNGQTHYGEKPPANKQSKQIHLRPAPAPSVSTPASADQDTGTSNTETRLQKQQRLIRALSEERKQKQEERARQQRMEKQRVRNCAVAKDNLRRYENSSAVYKVDDKGNRVILPNTARDKSIQRARAEVKKWCGGG